MRRINQISLFVLVAIIPLCSAETVKRCNDKKPTPKCCKKQEQPKEPCPESKSELDITLEKMHQKTSSLNTFQADVSYLFIQDPDLLDSQRLQKGKLYYKKQKNKSNIRINFNTLRIDEEDEENHKEQIIFDGVWLTKVDYQNETVSSWQQAEKDKPINAFEFVSKNFPMAGFTKTQDLRKHFDIKLAENSDNDPNNQIHLHLTVKKGSKYKDQYKKMDLWVGKKSFMPTRMLTLSIEGDIYDIRLLKPQVNKNIKNSVFMVETPKHFSQNREPLKKK